MKRHWIEYHDRWVRGPMTYWVHVAADGKPWYQSQVFEPPAPRLVPGKGFPLYFVQVDDAVLCFASLDELRVCMNTLSRKVLPSNLILSRRRGTGYGPSNHWLNRLPLRSMAWPYRQRVTRYLQSALTEFETEVQQVEPRKGPAPHQ